MTDEQAEPPPLVVEVSADTGPFRAAIRRAESEATFATHPDLRAMNSDYDEDGEKRT